MLPLSYRSETAAHGPDMSGGRAAIIHRAASFERPGARDKIGQDLAPIVARRDQGCWFAEAEPSSTSTPSIPTATCGQVLALALLLVRLRESVPGRGISP